MWYFGLFKVQPCQNVLELSIYEEKELKTGFAVWQTKRFDLFFASVVPSCG